DAPLARIGPWELTERIGEGTFSRVFRARPADLSGELSATAAVASAFAAESACVPGADNCRGAYALKHLTERWCKDALALGLFEREAAVSRRVANPHVISVLAADLRGSQPYVVTPWLPGASLDRWIARGRAFDLPEALWIARQVATALGALNDAGWMHGDVKPANIFLAPDGHVTLIDLGFACSLAAPVPQRVLGTWEYLAPEWMMTDRRPDERSDLYSLGIVLYELLARKHPLADHAELDWRRRHLVGTVPPLERLAPHVPPAVVTLVRSMLAKDPLRRPASARRLAEQLARLEIATFTERA
ncbi:MAG: serine/threonine-protein kinase, partial [Planctomycetota bacterium]